MKHKINKKYIRLPLFFALVFIIVTGIVLLGINSNKSKLINYTAPTFEEFNSLKLVNSISTPMDDSGSYWYASSESFKAEDGYIFTKVRTETETVVVDETAGTTEDVVHKFTIIMKVDFDGNELWSYEFESTNTGWNHDILVYEDIVFVAANYYGMFTLSVDNGSLLKSFSEYNCYDISIEGQYIAGISDTDFYLFDLNLNIVDSINVGTLETDTYDVWFYNYYYDGSNYYILGERDVDDVYTPYIFTLDSNLNLVNELQVTYDENQGYLYEKGYYSYYFNFIKAEDKFYQIGHDVHEIDASTGVNTILVNSQFDKFDSDYEEYFERTNDVLEVGNNILSLDTIYGDDTVSRVYISINNERFVFENAIQVNDSYSAESSYGENISLTENGILVKWYDFYYDMIYISEFEFTYEPVCTVVSGVGTEFGDKIQCGTESFYVTEYDGENVTMLSEYNLLAGYDFSVIYFDEPVVSSSSGDYYGEESVWDKVEEGYYIYSGISSYSSGTWTIDGVSFRRSSSKEYEYAGLKFDSSVAMTASDFYRLEEVKEKLLDGYFIGEIYDDNSQCDTTTTICTDNYYGMVFYKQNASVGHTIYFDDLVLKADIDTYLDSNSEYQEYYNNGYRVDDYLQERRYDGTSYTYYYSGIVLYKFIGDLNDPNYYGPFIQDETAIGAHGDESGNPEPNEVGIHFVNDGLYWGGNDAVNEGTGFYDTGFVDFELLYDGSVLYYLSYYNNYLSRMGVKTSEMTIPTVTDINNWAYDVTGNNIPLEDWYNNAVYEYSQNHEMNFYVLGPVKDYFVDYPWLYQTTYYLRTASPKYTTYFIDTLGYLCSANTCNSAIGAGIRPLVTMSIDNIAFDIITESDGNGSVVSSKSVAKVGDIITFETTPNEGYVLNSVTVTDENGNDIVYTDYKFTMPAADVVIEAKFDKIVYFEPLISISASSDKNYSVGSVYSYSIYVENPYDFELTDVLVTVDTLGAECLDSNCTKIDDYTFKFDTIRVHNSDRLRLLYTVLDIGTIEINAEILEAYAESPYFLNEDKEYKATSVATTKAGLEICNVLSGTGNGSVNQYYLIGYNDTEIAFSQWIVLQDNTCTKIAIPTDVTYRLTQIDKQEYNLEKVTGHITSNGSTFTVEPSTYKVTFYNNYEKKGYFHSWDRKENDIDIYSQPT